MNRGKFNASWIRLGAPVLLLLTLGLGFVAGARLGTPKAPDAAPSPSSTPDLVGDAADKPPAPDSEGENCFLGAVVPREEADVAAEIDGLVDSIAVRVGDRVDEGDVLAVLDTRALGHQATALEADLQAARAERRKRVAEAAQSEQEHARRSTLGELVSREEIDAARGRMESARAALAVAEAQIRQVEARLAEVSDSLERSTLRAPFPGLVSRRYLDPGARTATGTPVVRLARLDRLLVRFAVPPEGRSRLTEGTGLTVETVTDGRRFSGVVEQIAPEIDAASLLVFVEARLDVGSSSDGSGAPLFGAEARVYLGSTDDSGQALCSPALGSH